MVSEKIITDLLKIAAEFEACPLSSFGPGKGSLSARDLDTGKAIVTPSGMKFSSLTPDDLVITDIDGNVFSGARKPSLDLIFHLAVYRARPDVGGILHTHSPYATALSVLRLPVRVLILAMALMVGGDVEVAPFAFPGTPELGENIVQALGPRNAVLMEQHGVLAVGKDISRALSVAGTVENVAQIQCIAATQGVIRPLDAETIRRGMELEKRYGQGK